MSCLQIIRDAADECGIDPPSQIFGSGDPNVRLLLRFAQKAGDLLSTRHDWQALVTQHTFLSVATEAQAAAFPADYNRMNYTSDVWDRSRNLRYVGPSRIDTWQWLKNGVVGASGVLGYWRIIGGALNLFPAPPAGNTIALEYISLKWATTDGGVPTVSGQFEQDSNKARFPEGLITLDAIWRFKHRAGLDYAEDMGDFERELERASSSDRGMGVTTVGGRRPSTQSKTWPGVILP